MTQIIILAAGKGKRMQHEKLPKPLIPVAGKPILLRLLENIKPFCTDFKPIIIVGEKGDMIRKVCDDYVCIDQREQLGTGHAVAMAKEYVTKHAPMHSNVVVLYGDHPFVSLKTIEKLVSTHEKFSATLTMMTIVLPDFDDFRAVFEKFGRIKRNANGDVESIVEYKDATEEERKILEVNPAFFCFDAAWLWANIEGLGNDNVSREYYLTDLVKMALQQKKKVIAIPMDDHIEAIGVNTPEELRLAERFAK